MTLVVYVIHMKKSKWLDCQGNEFFPKQKGTPSLVKIEHKNTATLDSARSKKNLKSQFCNYSKGRAPRSIYTAAHVVRCGKDCILRNVRMWYLDNWST